MERRLLLGCMERPSPQFRLRVEEAELPRLSEVRTASGLRARCGDDDGLAAS